MIMITLILARCMNRLLQLSKVYANFRGFCNMVRACDAKISAIRPASRDLSWNHAGKMQLCDDVSVIYLQHLLCLLRLQREGR
jgi:hypothetical protein